MSPKRRKLDDQWMPPRVYRGKSAYEYHPKNGGAVRLCGLDAEKSNVWIEYEKAKVQESQEGSALHLIKLFIQSAQFNQYAMNTQKDYLHCKVRIEEAFGKMPAEKIQPKHIRLFMDARGKESTVRANRERSFFYAVYSWGYERGMVSHNPCKGVKPFKEKSRDKYITDQEYKKVYDIALPMIQVAMEIAYLCAARTGDILKITCYDVKENGLFIMQGKTGKKQIKSWTPRLRAAINLAQKQPSKIKTNYIIHNRAGQPYTSSGFKAIWRRYKLRAEVDCTFHDIKAKGISDYDGDKQRFSGHKSKSQMEVYNRKTEVVQTLNPKKK